MKAIWNSQVIAQSNDTIVVEGNHYFPENSLTSKYFSDSTSHTTCPYKGEASYFNVNVDGNLNENAAWYYPTPKIGYQNIAGRIAFWRGVRIEQE
jgi:uncharacterized protein (DUF427 family)